MCSTNFTVDNKKFCLSLYYNGIIAIYLLMAKNPLRLGGLSKDFDPSNVAKTGLTGYVYDFSVDCWTLVTMY